MNEQASCGVPDVIRHTDDLSRDAALLLCVHAFLCAVPKAVALGCAAHTHMQVHQHGVTVPHMLAIM
jgi:hypothetical protein